MLLLIFLVVIQFSEVLDFGDVYPVLLLLFRFSFLGLLITLGSDFFVETLRPKSKLIGHHFLEFEEAFGCLFLDPHVLSLSHFHGYKGSGLVDELELSPS